MYPFNRPYAVAVALLILECIVLWQAEKAIFAPTDVAKHWLDLAAIAIALLAELWLVWIYVRDGLNIRSSFRRISAEDSTFNYAKPPSVRTLFLFSCVMLLLQVVALKINLYWGLTVQVGALLFLTARRYENSERRLRVTHVTCRRVGVRSRKAHAFWSYRYRFFWATLDLITIDAAVSLLVVFEANKYGFYDVRSLIEIFLIFSAIAIPIYFMGLVPYWYYSHKGAYYQ